MKSMIPLVFFVLCGFAITKQQATESATSFKVDYENDRFLLDGKPFRYISGDIHYFRIHPDQWLDRLKRVRALGFNAIQYYIPWNWHEPERGSYDFGGDRDFVKFSKLAENLGMYTLLRIGPYVCAEWENGGLPYWLIANHKDMKQRSNDTRFTAEVTRWFSVLSKQIRPLLRHNGGPVLMVQIENEYGSYDACDHSYMSFLRDEVWRLLGPETQLYTTDGAEERYLKCGTVDGVFATVDFGPTSTQNVDKKFALQRRYLPNGRGPLVNSEFYPGWLVLWGQKEQKLPSEKSMINTAMAMWDKGASINFYMIHGGTNFGFWNGAEPNAPVITSYDYSAPITEAGDYSSAYWKIRTWIKGIPDWPNAPTNPPMPADKKTYETVKMKIMKPIRQITKDSCTLSTTPMSFEDLEQQFGYVLYYTTLKSCGRNLTIEKAQDFGYVYLSGRPQGRFVKEFWGTTVTTVNLKDCQKGDILEIIVENQGRQTFETINDYKGILSPVYLDGQPLTEWNQCGIDGSHSVADTWLNMSKWHKGFVKVNGVNLGRYWSEEGPQYNIYIPAPILKKGANEIAVVELIKVGGCDNDSCALPFSSSPDIHFDSASADSRSAFVFSS